MPYNVSDLESNDLVNLNLGLEALENQYNELVEEGSRTPIVIDTLISIRETREKLSKWDYRI